MGHWYLKDGSKYYTIKRSDGKGTRDTTLRDARKINAVPSVSTIIGQQASDYNLIKWKMENLLDLVISKGNLDNILKIGSDWKDKLLSESNYLNNTASRRGDEIHDHLENYFKTREIKEPEIIKPVIELINGLFPTANYHAEKTFCHVKGYGGCIDLLVETPDGLAIIDFKTKAKDKLDKSCIYGDNYLMQLAAYGNAYENVFLHANLLISTTKPGELYLHIWSEDDIIRGMNMFNKLLEYWQISNNYKPSPEVL